MSKTHLQTAHEYGVMQALKQAGYSSTEEVIKEAQELGLLEPPKTAAAPAADSVFAALKAKLG